VQVCKMVVSMWVKSFLSALHRNPILWRETVQTSMAVVVGYMVLEQGESLEGSMK